MKKKRPRPTLHIAPSFHDTRPVWILRLPKKAAIREIIEATELPIQDGVVIIPDRAIEGAVDMLDMAFEEAGIDVLFCEPCL